MKQPKRLTRAQKVQASKEEAKKLKSIKAISGPLSPEDLNQKEEVSNGDINS